MATDIDSDIDIDYIDDCPEIGIPSDEEEEYA